MLNRPGSIAALAWKILHDADREKFGAIYLDSRLRLIGYQIAYVGTLAGAEVEPRGIFSAALLCNAAHLVLFHNHPSGEITPSSEDLRSTQRMARAGSILGIRVLDHVIVAEGGRWTSLRQLGAIGDS